MNKYGLLAGLVASVGALLAAAGAIRFAWMRTSDWTPPEDDVPAGPAKVTSLLTAVAVAVLWFETGKSLTSRELEKVAIAAGILTVVALVIYAIMMGVFVYERQVARSDGNGVNTRKTVGGFWLTPSAKMGLAEAKTVQRLYAGSAYDPDLVWPRLSRSLVKTILMLSFMALLLCGSIAISSIALSIDPSASAAANKHSDVPAGELKKVLDVRGKNDGAQFINLPTKPKRLVFHGLLTWASNANPGAAGSMTYSMKTSGEPGAFERNESGSHNLRPQDQMGKSPGTIDYSVDIPASVVTVSHELAISSCVADTQDPPPKTQDNTCFVKGDVEIVVAK